MAIVESDSRYDNDGLIDDPVHPVIRDKGLWGYSHSNSKLITGHAAKKMGIPDYKLHEPDDGADRNAHNKLAHVLRSPGSKEPLYHGFQNRAQRIWHEGEIVSLSLTALSGDMQGSGGYGMRIDPKDNIGPGTVFEFPKGTRIVGYAKRKPEDAAEFGYVWSEAITAGKFKIVSVRQVPYENTWRRDVYLTVVRLEPVSYFDPDTETWVAA